METHLSTINSHNPKIFLKDLKQKLSVCFQVPDPSSGMSDCISSTPFYFSAYAEKPTFLDLGTERIRKYFPLVFVIGRRQD